MPPAHADGNAAASAAERAVAIAEEIEPARRADFGGLPDKDGVVVADATDVNDEPLPHNSCTAGEIGCVRSPAWNSERKIGSGCADAVCDVAATGVTARDIREAREIRRVVDRGRSRALRSQP